MIRTGLMKRMLAVGLSVFMVAGSLSSGSLALNVNAAETVITQEDASYEEEQEVSENTQEEVSEEETTSEGSEEIATSEDTEDEIVPSESESVTSEEESTEVPEESADEVSEGENKETNVELFGVDQGIPIDEIYFPDIEFRQYILNNFDVDDTTKGTEKDGKLSLTERNGVLSIKVKQVRDLTGIKYFEKLEELVCEECDFSVKKPDFTSNTALKKLNVNNCKLNTLGFSQNKELEEISCSGNELKVIDVSQNTALKKLYCANCALTELNVNSNKSLQVLDCTSNLIKTLNVSNNKDLTNLLCGNNKELKKLSVTSNIALKELNVSGNSMDTLDVSRNTSLQNLFCANNRIDKLTLTSNTALEILQCSHNYIKTLDLTKNLKLKSLKCSYNQIVGLDLRFNKFFGQEYDFTYNRLAYINLPEEMISFNIDAIAHNKFIADANKIVIADGVPGFICANAHLPENMDMTATELKIVDGAKDASIKYTMNSYNSSQFIFSVTGDAVPVTNLVLKTPNLTIPIGQSASIYTSILPVNAENQKVIYDVIEEDSCVTVDENGVVTATKAGTATIVVTSEANSEAKATCTVTVPTEESIEEQITTVFAGSITKLKDIELPNAIKDTYKWDDGDTNVAIYKDTEVTFTCVKKDGTYGELHVKVRFVSLNGVNISCNPGQMILTDESKKEVTLNLSPEYSLDIAGDKNFSIRYDVYDTTNMRFESVAQQGMDSSEWRIVGNDNTKNGTAKLKIVASIYETDSSTSISRINEYYTLQVSGGVNGINYSIQYKNDTVTKLDTFSPQLEEQFTINASAFKQDVTNLAVKAVSADKKIFKVEKQTDNSFLITVVGYGRGEIKLTATKDSKIKTSVFVTVAAKEPILLTTQLAMDKNKIETGVISVLPMEGKTCTKLTISNITPSNKGLYDSALVLTPRVNESNSFDVDFKDDIVASSVAIGSYKLALTATVDSKDYNVGNVTIKITQAKPKIVIKQTKNVNLFYTTVDANKEIDNFGQNAKGKIEFSSPNGEIDLLKTQFSDSDFLIDTNDGEISPNVGQINKRREKLVKKCNYSIGVKGYRNPVVGKFTIKTETVAPKLTINAQNVVLYTAYGMDETSLGIKCDKKDLFEVFPNAKITLDESCKEQFELKSSMALKPKNLKPATAKILVKCEDWANAITLSVKIVINNKIPEIDLDKKELVINQKYNQYEVAETDINVKNGEGFSVLRAYTAPADEKARSLEDFVNVFYDTNSQKLRAEFSPQATTWKKEDYVGSYNYRVTPVITRLVDGKLIAGCANTVTVKVTLTNADAKITVSGKGSVDVLQRTKTGVNYTTKTTGINGDLTGAKLVGVNRSLFMVSKLEKGIVTVTALPDAQLRTDKKYPITIEYTYKSKRGEVKLRASALVAVTQTKVKLQTKQTLNYYLSNRTNQYNIVSIASNSSEINGVSVKLADPTGAFELTQVDPENGQSRILLKDRTRVIGGKSYTVKLLVSFNNGAKNMKPQEVSVKIKINK